MKLIIFAAWFLLLASSSQAYTTQQMQQNPNKVFALSGQQEQWALDLPGSGVEARDAWVVSQGEGVRVGVVDTGIDASHEDLVGAIAGAESFIQRDASADPNGHGTHVAGIIAARNNDIGVSGIAPLSKVVALQAVNQKGVGKPEDIVKAFEAAKRLELRIINASLGTFGYSPKMFETIYDNPNALFVVASGNTKTNNDKTPLYPCAFELDNVLCVGASTEFAQPAAFSNWGKNSVDVYAPGDNIASTWTGNSYATVSGTSMAAPLVSGIAALILAKYPEFTTQQLKAAIVDSTVKQDAFSSLSVSGGIVDAEAALEAAQSISQGEVTDSLRNVAVPDLEAEYSKRRCKSCKRTKVDVTYRVLHAGTAVLVMEKQTSRGWATIKTIQLVADGKFNERTISARRGKYRLRVKAENSSSITGTKPYVFKVT